MAQSGIGVQLFFYQHELDPAPLTLLPLHATTLGGDLPVIPATDNAKWNRFASIIDLDVSGPDATIIDAKNLSSVSATKAKTRGFKDGGMLSMRCSYVNETLRKCLYLFKDYLLDGNSTCINTAKRLWDLRIPSSACGATLDRYLFHGYLKTSGLEIPEDDRMIFSIEIKVVDAPVAIIGGVRTDSAPGSAPVAF